MDYPMFILSNQKEESISIQKVNSFYSGYWYKTGMLANSEDLDKMPHNLCGISSVSSLFAKIIKTIIGTLIHHNLEIMT